MRIVFILPTKNEAKTIKKIIEDIKMICDLNNISVVKILIADDSIDATRLIAKKCGAEVVIGGGKGLGQAMLRGLKRACLFDTDYVISIDADGQVDLNEIPKFIEAAKEETADFVLGSRFLRKGLIQYRYPIINRMGILILSKILRSITKLPLTDSHGGIRLLAPCVIDNLEIIGSHTYVQETIIDASENGFKIIEIPSKWLKRKHGKSRVVFSISKYIFYTLPILFLRAGLHIKLIFPIGIGLIILSLLDILIVGLETQFSLEQMFIRQTFNLFFLLFSTGINLFFFGIILELIASLKTKTLK